MSAARAASCRVRTGSLLSIGLATDDAGRTTTMTHRAATWTTLAVLAALASIDRGDDAHAQQQEDVPEGTVAVGDLLWYLGSTAETVPWSEAHEYCETLEHGGFDDWRLPVLAELETLHDPSADDGIRAPFELADCCAWSSTNLVELPAEAKGVLPDPTNDPADYYWGFLFTGGVRYYSFGRFPDGLAMCVREP